MPAGLWTRPDDMVWLPGGQFIMGSDGHYPEEAPAHPVSVGGFWIDPHPVTNSQFQAFVAATGYRTLAERPANALAYPGTEVAMLAPASIVFTPPSHPVDLSDPTSGGRTCRAQTGSTLADQARRCATASITR